MNASNLSSVGASADRKDVIIVGGGLIGLFSAYYFARDGRKVTIIEKRRVGSGAARGNAGMIMAGGSVPLPAPGVVGEGLRLMLKPTSAFFVKPSKLASMGEFLATFALHSNSKAFDRSAAKLDLLNRETRQLFKELQADGVGTELRDTPYVHAYSHRESAEAAHKVSTAIANRGLVPQPGPILDRRELVALEPAVGDEVTCGYQVPGELSADPSRMVDELIAKVTELGVEFIDDAAVDSIDEHGDHVTVHAGARSWDASQVLVAAGAWSAPLLKQLGLRSLLKPAKGYSFTVKVKTDPAGLTLFGDAHVAALPMRPGLVRIAGTLEFDEDTNSHNDLRVKAIVDAAKGTLKDADWNSLQDVWSAPRPMTPDGLPHIGRAPGRNRTFVCVGHNMLGLSLGPSSAVAITDIMQGRGNPQIEKAFAPNRFRLLRLKR
ncbi:FAD-binding oxidoreductase [Mycobacterium sp. 141]|uniref:NAD(P)/FAD-dependent oxidoreductase n=1 Tax=Mycobacterium sp. 141 TaxID=1120797 RepID=UPI0003A2E0A1|nr:FAD-binding oxidoreductase [Mycobacterium sp. 141]